MICKFGTILQLTVYNVQLTIDNYDKTSRKGAKHAKKQYKKLRVSLRLCEKKKNENEIN